MIIEIDYSEDWIVFWKYANGVPLPKGESFQKVK